MPRTRALTPPVTEYIHIDSLDKQGRGVGRVNGKPVHVVGSLPGEKVGFQRCRSRRRSLEGVAVEIAQPSSNRVLPQCKHADVCGGCTLQHLEYGAQVEFKQSRLLEELRTVADASAPAVLTPLVGEPWAYRRKARLSVKYVQKKGGALVGFREKFSNKVADVSCCEILHPSVGLRLGSIRETISSLEACDRIPQIEVAVGDRFAVLVVRHLTCLSESDQQILREMAMSEGFQVCLQSGGPDSVTSLWPRCAGPLSYVIPNYELELRHGPTDFTQVNWGINRNLVAKAIELISPEAGDRILDLFCGIGNFTLPLARFAKRTVGLEGSRVLVERARDNARFNSIANAEFHVVDLTRSDVGTAWMRRQWDKLLLDPPRAGAHEVLKTLESPYPSRIVYVSCNPTTLARDAEILVGQHGYVLKAAGVVDMFPHTNHVESITLFEHV